MGPCAKTVVTCTLVTPSGEKVVGRNDCLNPQIACPRGPGEGYEKCDSICGQQGHAEVQALRAAGEKARGATAYIEGHTYACQSCQHALFDAGVRFIARGAPPQPWERTERDMRAAS